MKISMLSGLEAQNYTDSAIFNAGHEYSPLTGITGFYDSKVSSSVYNARKVALALGRGAFLLLVKYNVWGLGSIINSAKRSSKAKATWDIAWYNLGGSPSTLFGTASTGSGRKAILMGTAPSSIVNAYESRGISGISGFDSPFVGMGSTLPYDDPLSDYNDATSGSSGNWTETLNKAAEIIEVLVSLIVGTIALVGGNDFSNGIDYGSAGINPPDINPDDSKYNIAGGGIVIGLLVLGLILSGGLKNVTKGIEK